MTNFDDFDFSRTGRDFAMTNPVVVATNGKGEPVVAYTSTNKYNGRVQAHIRSVYKGHSDEWLPGKGVAFERNEIVGVLERLIERFAAEEATAPAVSSERQPAAEPAQPANEPTNEAFKSWTTDELRRHIDKSNTSGALKDRMRAELARRDMPKMSNGLEGLARLKNIEPTDAQMDVFMHITAQLSPENLSCDGELSRSQIEKRRQSLQAQWKAAEKGLGRKMTEDEVWKWWERKQAARRAATARTKTEMRRSRR